MPNGGRVYYIKRSQPPLLTEMVYHVYTAMKKQPGGETAAAGYLENALALLKKEYEFWTGEKHRRSLSNPRPCSAPPSAALESVESVDSAESTELAQWTLAEGS